MYKSAINSLSILGWVFNLSSKLSSLNISVPAEVILFCLTSSFFCLASSTLLKKKILSCHQRLYYIDYISKYIGPTELKQWSLRISLSQKNKQKKTHQLILFGHEY